VVGPSPAGPQAVHGADQRHSAVVRAGRRPVPAQRDHVVRVFRAHGPQHWVRHRPVHIVQRRSVRAQAPWLAHIRPERVLLHRLLLRHHRVCHHRQLEDLVARLRLRARRQHRYAIAGEFHPVVHVIGRRRVDNIFLSVFNSVTRNKGAQYNFVFDLKHFL